MAAVLGFYVLFPALIIYLCIRFPLADKIGMIILCYAAGLILGNIHILPAGSETMQNSICEATVALSLPLLGYVLCCVFGSMALHGLFCRIFKIDTDTFIITSASAICSPPFVPVVAGALKNRAIILSGLTTGIIGYAVGNYLGITMAYIVKSLLQ
ncbi:MAG: DUF819 family protein [Desulfobacter sp.]|nr:MAG: DUF819 family protein [Desulfobacter sp.]